MDSWIIITVVGVTASNKMRTVTLQARLTCRAGVILTGDGKWARVL